MESTHVLTKKEKFEQCVRKCVSDTIPGTNSFGYIFLSVEDIRPCRDKCIKEYNDSKSYFERFFGS